MGFWSHPDLTLDKAQYAIQWLKWQYEPDEIVLIEHVASGDYSDCRLHAIWWWDVPQATDRDAPFALPAGFTEFRFRSYEPLNNEYLVTAAGEPRDYDTTLPMGTVVTVRC